MERFIQFMEYVGIFSFAVSGSIVAIQEDFDLFGIFCLATVTAMGGGVLRDIVANIGVPLFFKDWTTLPLIFAATTLSCVLGNRWKYNRLFVALDAMGLSAFVVSSGLKAIDARYNFMLFIFATAITGVGGGIMRDIIVNRKPSVFQSDIYTIAGMIGAILLWLLYPLIGMKWSACIALLIIFFIRMVCYIKHINLPIIKYSQIKEKSNV